MNKLSSLSIFFPAFNEEVNIKIVVQQTLDLAPKVSQKFEILVIDDGSVDNTAAVVKDMAKQHKQIRLIQHKVNMGYGNALKTGFYNSKYDFITYMDADNQFDFSQLNKLLARINEADLVVGYRIKRADNFVRRLNGRMWNIMVALLLNLPIKDIDCGFKLIKKEVIDNISELESTGATISAELLVKAQKKSFKIVQVGLIHKERRYGSPTGGNVLHIFRAFHDLFQLLPKLAKN